MPDFSQSVAQLRGVSMEQLQVIATCWSRQEFKEPDEPSSVHNNGDLARIRHCLAGRFVAASEFKEPDEPSSVHNNGDLRPGFGTVWLAGLWQHRSCRYCLPVGLDKRLGILSVGVASSPLAVCGCHDDKVRLLAALEVRLICSDGQRVVSLQQITIHGRFLHGVRPLWCATVGGQYAVIDYLLSKGANVNGITRFNSTPLRAACIHGHLDIAKLLVEHGASTETTDPYSFTCLMLAAHNRRLEIVKYLLEIGVDVNGKSMDGQSALHVSAEIGHIEIMKVLLDHNGQMDADISGITPLILASFRCHLEMVEYLVSRTDLISVKEKADAFELLGASLLDDLEDIVSVIQYWKSAMSHRYVDGVLTYPKSELNLEGPAHEEFREVTTLEQLEAIETDFESVQRQSLLVKERVLGPDHFTTLLYIRDAGLDYANDGAFKQCINLWVHAIEVQYFRLKPLNHARLYHFRSFVGLFSSLTDAEHVSNWNRQPKDFFDDIMCVFEKGARELNLVVSELDQSDISVKKLNESHLNECVAIIMHLLVSLTMLQPQLSSSQIHTFRSALYQLLKKDPRDAAGWSLLHIAWTGFQCRCLAP
ncbi:protein fem-1 homolog A-like [Macrobrachium nipponense]|uniref:protein fem-1 homolog A-like n=1 Tax=Macrobrachium nipponense TaxID=159736 RepID=UPI0030C86317